MNVSDAIRTKRAVRQFADQPIPDDAVRAILLAGQRAQSSKNSQPWRFVVVRDKATLGQLAQCGDYASGIWNDHGPTKSCSVELAPPLA